MPNRQKTKATYISEFDRCSNPWLLLQKPAAIPRKPPPSPRWQQRLPRRQADWRSGGPGRASPACRGTSCIGARRASPGRRQSTILCAASFQVLPTPAWRGTPSPAAACSGVTGPFLAPALPGIGVDARGALQPTPLQSPMFLSCNRVYVITSS